LSITIWPPRARITPRPLRIATVVDEDVAPQAGFDGDVRDVEHEAGQHVVGEDARLDAAAGLADHQGVHDLPEGLVGAGTDTAMT